MPYRGEVFALLTALCWAGSSTSFAYASRAAGGLPVNQFRLLLAVPVLMLLAALLTGQWWPTHLTDDRMLLLVASGLIGLVLGDIGFFHALAVLGPRVSSVVMATWPAFTVAIEVARGHLPTAWVALGIAMTALGVVLALLRTRAGTAWNPGMTPRQWAIGLAGALLGAVGQAGGVVLASAAMATGADLPGGVIPLQATVVRMAAAAVGMQCVALAHRRPLAFGAVLRDRRVLGAALFGCAFGPICGVWLSMAAIRQAHDVGVAASLMATTPIFMMPISALLYGARIGWLGGIGTVLAVAGAALMLLFS
ncbi:MAG: DMT family transporter [Planctomycetes bacterium]|nr:DMT family transporter [Planctomycetota bacterium]